MMKVSLDNAVMKGLYEEVIYPEFGNAVEIEGYVKMLEYLRSCIEISKGDKNYNMMLSHELKKIVEGLKDIEEKMLSNMGVAIVSLGSQEFIKSLSKK